MSDDEKPAVGSEFAQLDVLREAFGWLVVEHCRYSAEPTAAFARFDKAMLDQKARYSAELIDRAAAGDGDAVEYASDLVHELGVLVQEVDALRSR